MTGACVKMMEVETASSITSVTISSIMEFKDWEIAISGTIMSWFIYHKSIFRNFISNTGNIFEQLGDEIKAQASRNYTSHED